MENHLLQRQIDRSEYLPRQTLHPGNALSCRMYPGISSGMSIDEILEDYDDLERDDILAVLMIES